MGKITGRSDDMLIIRGVNVFPSQIEELVLQEEKLALAEALDNQRRYVNANPAVAELFSDEERDDLREVSAVFQSVLRENHQKLLIARKVNDIIRTAIVDTMAESNPLNMYDLSGKPDGDGLPPVALNQKI